MRILSQKYRYVQTRPLLGSQETYPRKAQSQGIPDFQNPVRLEITEDGERRTKIYFCNPHGSWQKGMLEKNHEYIRLVVSKCHSLDCYICEDVLL